MTSARPVVITTDDATATDVADLIDRHLAFARAVTPPADVHALPAESLTGDDIEFFSARVGDTVVGIGALRRLDAGHAEIKSMHTVAAVRGRGVGRTMLTHLIDTARGRGYRRVSLETGSMEAFGPARALYASAGFTPCGPFADYEASPTRVCMTLTLDAPG